MRSFKPVCLTMIAAAWFYGCGGCQDEAPAPTAPAAPATIAPAAPGAKAPAAAEPKANGEDDDVELLMWASGEPDSGPPPLAVTFTVESLEEGFDNPIYEWDFGDGSPASKEASPTHTYTKPGQYTARVTVTQVDGQKGHDETWVEIE